MFPYAGAYTICAASNYGGVCFTQPQKIFVYSSAGECALSTDIKIVADWSHFMSCLSVYGYLSLAHYDAQHVLGGLFLGAVCSLALV